MHLIHYVHCPFCVRVRMVLGALGLSYNSEVLPYHNEERPMGLTGKKMLPIMEINGSYLNESLEIIEKLDAENDLNSRAVIESYRSEIEPVLNKLGKDVHSLAMPYWMLTPEFDQESRRYFQNKKEAKRGPFKDLVARSEEISQSLESSLEEYSKIFEKDLAKNKIDLKDILVAAHLWGMYIVPEFQFSSEIHSYLQGVKKQTNFNYHEDFWR